MSLRDKAIAGASWSLAGRIAQQLSAFVIGIVLARLLTPEQYGIVGMATIFIYISFVFIDSGFSSALIQRYECSQTDYSTIFYINLSISILVYSIFYLLAPSVANFYKEPELTLIFRVLSLLIILFALSLVQNSIIIKELRFKLKTQIEITAQLLSGLTGIYLAIKGYGVWALVWKTLLNQFFIIIQLWIRNKWFPSFEFSRVSLKEMFSFSSRLLISGILERAYQQLYKLIIGKFFTAKELGLFTKAEQFQKFPTQTITGAITSLIFPVFSKLQNEPERLKSVFQKILSTVMFLNINAMVGLSIIARPMILSLIGEKWIDATLYLQLLAMVGVFYPMHLINVQILSSLGRSDLVLRIEIIKKTVTLPTLLLGIFISIKAMLIGMILSSIIGLFINTYYTNKLIHVGLKEQLKEISPSFIIAFLMASSMIGIGLILKLQLSDSLLFITQIIIGLVTAGVFSHILNLNAYVELRTIILEKLAKINVKKR